MENDLSLQVENNSQEKKTFGQKVKNIWDKTIFAKQLEEKKKEKAYDAALRLEAKERAKERIKEALIMKYAQEEIDKATGANKAKKANKFAEEFGSVFANSDEKLAKMLGTGSKNDNVASDDKISRILGGSRESNENSMLGDDKISRMLDDSNEKMFGMSEKHKDLSLNSTKRGRGRPKKVDMDANLRKALGK
jgi:hypothetical protein